MCHDLSMHIVIKAAYALAVLPRPALRDQTFGALVSHRRNVSRTIRRAVAAVGPFFPRHGVARFGGGPGALAPGMCLVAEVSDAEESRGISMENLQILVESSFGVAEWDEISRMRQKNLENCRMCVLCRLYRRRIRI